MKEYEVVLVSKEDATRTQVITATAGSPSEAERMAWDGFYAAVGPVEAMGWRVGYIVTKGDAYE